MKKILSIIMFVVVAGCSTKEHGNISIEEPQTTTTLPLVDCLNEEVIFNDIISSGIETISLKEEGITIHFKSDRAKKELVDYISNIPLYTNYQEYVNTFAGAEMIIIDRDGDTHIYEEKYNIITYTCSKKDICVGKYGYHSDSETMLYDKLYLSSKFHELIKPYNIPLLEYDFLTILKAETDDYLIESELGNSKLFRYDYSNIKGFNPKEYGLKIFKNDLELEELPFSIGEHTVVLSKDNVSYQLNYYCK